MLALARWPRLTELEDAEAEAEVGWIVELISEVRSLRAEMNLPAGAEIALVVVGAISPRKPVPRIGGHAETTGAPHRSGLRRRRAKKQRAASRARRARSRCRWKG